jgi:glycosyltransferase involved in cell wall biosynthesis
MRRLLDSATAIVMNTPGSGEAVRRHMPGLADRVRVIPNGYDAADFAGPVAQPDPRVFRIVFSGYAHTSYGKSYRRFGALRSRMGGAAAGLDPLSRSHVFLLRAIAEMLVQRPDLADVLEVHLAGVGSDDEAHELECVIAHGYVPHTRAVELVRTADLLFLPLHDLAPGVRGLTVPAKSYEYLASGRPILAAIPAGDTRDLLSGAPSVTCCLPRDVAAIARTIESAVDAWRVQGTKGVDRSSFIAPYERRQLSRQLAAVFDEVVRTADR